VKRLRRAKPILYPMLLVCALGVLTLACASLSPTAPPNNPSAPPSPTARLAVSTATPGQPTATHPSTAPTIPASQPVPGTLRPTQGPRLPGPATATGALATRFEAALNAGDVESVLALFGQDAEVKVPPDRYVGLTQIRNWVSYLAANHFAIEPGFRQVVGERALWPAEVRSDYLARLGLPSVAGTASLVVQDNHIRAYTFVLTEEAAHRHRAAQVAASQVLQDPIIVGQDAANVYGFSDVFRDSAGRLVSYRDVLTAEPGTGPFYDLGGQPIAIRSGL